MSSAFYLFVLGLVVGADLFPGPTTRLICVAGCTIGYLVDVLHGKLWQTHHGFGYRFLLVLGLAFFLWRFIMAVRAFRDRHQPDKTDNH